MRDICESAEPAPTSCATAVAYERRNPMHTQKVAGRHGKAGLHRILRRSYALKATIDVFVQSLVIAGFCSDHTPRKHFLPVHKATTPGRSCTFSTLPNYRYHNTARDRLNCGVQQFPFASRISRIHLRSLNTHADRKDSDDGYDDILDNPPFTNTTDQPLNTVGNDHTSAPPSIHYVSGKGPSEWPAAIRRQLNVPIRNIVPKEGLKSRKSSKHTEHLEAAESFISPGSSITNTTDQPLNTVGTDNTSAPPFSIHYVSGKGPSEWPAAVRRQLNVPIHHIEPKEDFKPTKATKPTESFQPTESSNPTTSSLTKPSRPTGPLNPWKPTNSDKLIIEKRLQDNAHVNDLRLFLETLYDKSMSNQYLFSLYKRLPSPGVKMLTRQERSRLMRRFANPPDKRRSNARCFLSLFDDLIQADFQVSRIMFKAAIFFISHRVPVLEERDLQEALALWHRMDKVLNIESDSAVFELLFRIASETGRFAVADRFLSEMKLRGLSLSRHGRLSVMFSYGRRRDVDSIYQSFESIVQSGDVVDTATINCLISSLLIAGEPDTAKQLYTHMMHQHRITIGTSQDSIFHPSLSPDYPIWKTGSKRLNSLLSTYLTRQSKLSDVQNQPLQDLIPVSPDTRTFHILLRYHCLRTGDMQAISQLMVDMEEIFDVPPRSFVFYFLFRGFAIHTAAKGWTEELLLEVYAAFKRALYESYTRMSCLETDGWAPEPKWENPLQSICDKAVEYSDSHAEEQQEGNVSQDKLQRLDAAVNRGHTDIVPEGESLMKLFDEIKQMGEYHKHWFPDQNMARRIENGIFLGRELNIVMLKAFGAHCGSNTLLRVFSQIERMWKPWKRLGRDVQSVKKELQKQLAKAQSREDQI